METSFTYPSQLKYLSGWMISQDSSSHLPLFCVLAIHTANTKPRRQGQTGPVNTITNTRIFSHARTTSSTLIMDILTYTFNSETYQLYLVIWISGACWWTYSQAECMNSSSQKDRRSWCRLLRRWAFENAHRVNKNHADNIQTLP